MSEKKLTPAEAFEHLQAVFPSIVSIRLNSHTFSVIRPDNCTDFVFTSDAANIDWGDATSYKPTRWRPATIEDLSKSVSGAIYCRFLADRTGLLIGGRQIEGEASRIAYVASDQNLHQVLQFRIEEIEVLE